MPLTPTILRRTLLRAGFAAAALAAWPLARAQQGGVVRAWQGFGPGSIPEQIGRLVLNAVAERTGRTFVVEGKVGAAEKILAAYMAKAPADGQQLYLMTAVQTVHTALDKELKYDVRKDFTLIGSIVQYPFILSVGMAVDSNVLVFERIREELRAGKTPRAAIETGFTLAFGTIIDTHLTTIIAALFLFQFGTGPVRGFAVTLLIGLAASVFTAFFVSKVIFQLMYDRQGRQLASISI